MFSITLPSFHSIFCVPYLPDFLEESQYYYPIYHIILMAGDVSFTQPSDNQRKRAPTQPIKLQMNDASA